MLRASLRACYWAFHNTWQSLGARRGVRVEPTVQWRGDVVVEMGQGTYVGARTVVSGDAGAQVRMGRRVWLGADCELSALGCVDIGDDTTLQHRTQLHGDVRIGAGCTGAAGLYISSGWHEFRREPALPIRLQDRARANLPAQERSRPVEVGDDCWLGIGVAVMPGVHIGRGCVVGAHAVVTHDLPPYSIAVGIPAKVIAQRLDYKPPARLDAQCDDHLPYFDAGFSQIAGNGQDIRPPRLLGGLATCRPDFRLALAAEVGQRITLQVHAMCAGRLRHAGDARRIEAGRHALDWTAQPDERARLTFEWMPEAVQPDPTLVVIEASASSSVVAP